MDDAAAPPEATAPIAEGLRERKKRLTRQLISDTATGMFLDRGFEDVRITEIAAACGVSEKTIYNYFPTKESLLFDRTEEFALRFRKALGPGAPERSPIEATLEVLSGELAAMRREWEVETGSSEGLGLQRRFFDLIEQTPALRAALREMLDHLSQVAAQAMAERAGVSPDDPEPQIAAQAIIGLWSIQFHGLRRHVNDGSTPDEVLAKVTDEVQRAARLLDGGLWSFAVMVAGNASHDQLRVAAQAAQRAANQVASAMAQARDAFRHTQQAAGGRTFPGPMPDRRTQRLQFEQWKHDLKAEQRRLAMEHHHEKTVLRREQAAARRRPERG